jgi:hypothetical protein
MVIATRAPSTWATLVVPVQSSEARAYRPIGPSIYSVLQVRGLVADTSRFKHHKKRAETCTAKWTFQSGGKKVSEIQRFSRPIAPAVPLRLEEQTKTLEVTHHWREGRARADFWGRDPTETSAGKLVSRLARAVRPTAPQGS